MVMDIFLSSKNTKGRSQLASFFILVFLSSFFWGCASYTTQTKKMRQMFRGNDYAEALAALDESELAKQSQSKFLFLVERATLLDRMGQRTLAQKFWEDAFKLSERLYTKSISKEVATYLINDSFQDYRGEDYERVFVPLMKAMSYLGVQKKSEAGVEARRMNQLLKQINSEYEGNKNSYREDGYAYYLSGLILKDRGDKDNALVAFRKAIKAFEGPFGKFSEGTPNGLVEETYFLAVDLGRSNVKEKLVKDFPFLKKQTKKDKPKSSLLIVSHQVGMIPMKRQSEFVFRVGSQVVRASFPVIRPNSYGKWFVKPKVSIGSKTFKSELVSDLSEIASQTLEDQRGRMILKHGARLLAKGQIAEQARQNYGEAAGLLVNVFNLFTETADTRSWTTLPERIYVTRARIRPGKYKVQINTDGKIKEVSLNLKPGKTTFVNHRG